MRKIMNVVLAIVVAVSAGGVFAQEETFKAHGLHIVLLQQPCRVLDTRITGTPLSDGEVLPVWVQGDPCRIPATAAASW